MLVQFGKIRSDRWKLIEQRSRKVETTFFRQMKQIPPSASISLCRSFSVVSALWQSLLCWRCVSLRQSWACANIFLSLVQESICFVHRSSKWERIRSLSIHPARSASFELSLDCLGDNQVSETKRNPSTRKYLAFSYDDWKEILIQVTDWLEHWLIGSDRINNSKDLEVSEDI